METVAKIRLNHQRILNNAQQVQPSAAQATSNKRLLRGFVMIGIG
jgi:hypothetical protein